MLPTNHQNTGSADAAGAVITDTLPAGIYYSHALDAGSGPAPTTVVTNPCQRVHLLARDGVQPDHDHGRCAFPRPT